MEEHEDDEHARAPAVHAAHQPAEREVVADVDDRLPRDRLARMGVGRRRRHVVHREDHAGDRLHEKSGERGRAERLHPVDVRRHIAEEEVAEASDESRPFLEPVDGIEDGRLHLLAADLGLRRLPSVRGGHQLCGGCRG